MEIRALGLAVLLLCIGALSASAEPVPEPVTRLGTYPLMQTENARREACHLHQEAHGMPLENCLRLMEDTNVIDEGCEDYTLQDGDVMWMPFTVNGETRLKFVVIAFGDAVGEDDSMRAGVRCGQMVKPLACGNYSVVPLELRERCVLVCSGSNSRVSYSGVHTSGIYRPRCERFYGGVSTEAFTDGGAGQTCVCLRPPSGGMKP